MSEHLSPSPVQITRTGLLSNRLVRELLSIAAIKLFLLFALWFAFFRQPDVTPPGSREVSAALLGSGSIPLDPPPAAEPASNKGDLPW